MSAAGLLWLLAKRSHDDEEFEWEEWYLEDSDLGFKLALCLETQKYFETMHGSDRQLGGTHHVARPRLENVNGEPK